MTGPRGNQIQPELNRDIGLVSVLAISVGTMIAAGILTLSGLAVGYVGSAAIAVLLLAALVAWRLVGNIPENLARRAVRSVVVINRHDPVKALVGRVLTE